MSQKNAPSSPLVAAALSFDAELVEFARLADVLAKSTFDGEKQLERAAVVLTEIADCEERMGKRAQELMGALTTARDRQQKQAAAVTERAKEVEARTRTFQELLERFRVLGEEAASLNQLGGEMGASAPKDREGAARDLLPQLDELHQRMGALSDKSLTVADDAKEASFAELARKAHELRQQLLAARNKVGLLQQRLTS